MAVLSPDLVQQVGAVPAAATAAEEAAAGAPAADAEPAAAAADSSSSEDGAQQGPWLLLVTCLGTAKRVLLSDVPCKANRGPQGVIGIKLNAGGWRERLLAGTHFAGGFKAEGVSQGQRPHRSWIDSCLAGCRKSEPQVATTSRRVPAACCHAATGDSLAMAQIVHSDDDDVVVASKQGVVMRCAAKDVPQFGRAAKGCRLMTLQPEDEVQTLTILPAEYKTVLA